MNMDPTIMTAMLGMMSQSGMSMEQLLSMGGAAAQPGGGFSVPLGSMLDDEEEDEDTECTLQLLARQHSGSLRQARAHSFECAWQLADEIDFPPLGSEVQLQVPSPEPGQLYGSKLEEDGRITHPCGGYAFAAHGPFACEYPALHDRRGAGAAARLPPSKVVAPTHPLHAMGTRCPQRAVTSLAGLSPSVATAAGRAAARWLVQDESRCQPTGGDLLPLQPSRRLQFAFEAAVTGRPYMALQVPPAPLSAQAARLAAVPPLTDFHSQSPEEWMRAVQQAVLDIRRGTMGPTNVEVEAQLKGGQGRGAPPLHGAGAEVPYALRYSRDADFVPHGGLPSLPPTGKGEGATGAAAGAAADGAAGGPPGGAGGGSAQSVHWPVACNGTELQYLEEGITPASLHRAWQEALSAHRQLTVDVHPAMQAVEMQCNMYMGDEECEYQASDRAFPPLFVDGVGLTGPLRVRLTANVCLEHGGFSQPPHDLQQPRSFWLRKGSGRDLLFYRLRCGLFFVSPNGPKQWLLGLLAALKRTSGGGGDKDGLQRVKEALLASWRLALVSRLASRHTAVQAMSLALAARGVPRETVAASQALALYRHVRGAMQEWEALLGQPHVLEDVVGALGRLCREVARPRPLHPRNTPQGCSYLSDSESNSEDEDEKVERGVEYSEATASYRVAFARERALNERGRRLFGEPADLGDGVPLPPPPAEGDSWEKLHGDVLWYSFQALEMWAEAEGCPLRLGEPRAALPDEEESLCWRSGYEPAAAHTPMLLDSSIREEAVLPRYMPVEDHTRSLFLSSRVPDSYRHAGTVGGQLVNMQGVPVYQRSLLKIAQRLSGFGMDQVVVLRRLRSALDGPDAEGATGMELPRTHGFALSRCDYQLHYPGKQRLDLPFIIANMVRVAQPDADGAPQPVRPEPPAGTRVAPPPLLVVMGHAETACEPVQPLIDDEDMEAVVAVTCRRFAPCLVGARCLLPETHEWSEWRYTLDEVEQEGHLEQFEEHTAALRRIVGDDLDVWLLDVPAGGKHAEASFAPALPPGPCAAALVAAAAEGKDKGGKPRPRKKVNKKKAAKRAAEKAAAKASSLAAKCAWRCAGTLRTDMVCWGGWLMRDVRLGQYECTAHGHRMPMELRPGVDPNDASLLMTHTHRTGHSSASFPSAGAGSVHVCASGRDMVLTPDIAQMCVLGLLGAVRAAREGGEGGGSMFDPTTDAHPLAVAYRVVLGSIAYRMRAVRLDVEAYLQQHVSGAEQWSRARRTLAGAMRQYVQETFAFLDSLRTEEFMLEVFRQTCALCAPWVLDPLRAARWPLPPMLELVGMTDQMTKACIHELARAATVTHEDEYGTLKTVTSSASGRVTSFQQAKLLAARENGMWAMP